MPLKSVFLGNVTVIVISKVRQEADRTTGSTVLRGKTRKFTRHHNQAIDFVQFCCIYKKMPFNFLNLVKMFNP